jgi:hypothetical protein
VASLTGHAPNQLLIRGNRDFRDNTNDSISHFDEADMHS